MATQTPKLAAVGRFRGLPTVPQQIRRRAEVELAPSVLPVAAVKCVGAVRCAQMQGNDGASRATQFALASTAHDDSLPGLPRR